MDISLTEQINEEYYHDSTFGITKGDGMAGQCVKCGQKATFINSKKLFVIAGKEYCSECAKDILDKEQEKLIFTTTHTVEGHKIEKYLGVESFEVVLGTGLFSEFSSSIDDFFGSRSSAFEQKLGRAKKVAFQMMTKRAIEMGANAVVGIDLDYTEFSSNRVGLIVNGTFVKVE